MFDDSEQRFTVDRTRSERRPFHRLPLALDKELHLPVDKDPTDQISLVFGPVVTERIEQKVIDIDHPAIRVGPILLYVGILPHRMFAIELENIAVHIEQQNIVCDLELSLEFSAIAVFDLHLLFPLRFQYVVDIGGDFMQNLLQPAENGKSIVKNLLIQSCGYTQYDEHGYMIFDCISKGYGYYVTNGKALYVSWEKTSMTSPTRYYDMDGNEITLNTGKTYVGFVPVDDWEDLVIE